MSESVLWCYCTCQTRWAWGQESRSSLETLVAPRETPAWWLPRLMVLLALTWCLVTATVLSFTVLPLVVGRKIFHAAQIPVWLHHDPVCFMIGVTFCWLVFLLVTKICSKKGRKYINSLRRIPRVLLVKAVRNLLAWICIELSLGLLVEVLISHSITSFSSFYHHIHHGLPGEPHTHLLTMTMSMLTSAAASAASASNKLDLFHYLLSINQLVCIYLKGAAISSIFCGLIMYGYVDSFLSLFQLQLPDAAQVLLAQQLGDQTIQRTHPVIQSVIGT